MIKGIQIVGILVGIYLFAQTNHNFRKGNISLNKTIILSGIWGSLIILFIKPRLAELALPILSTQDMLLTVQVMGILISYVLITHIMMQISSLNRKLITLTQNIAVKNYLEEPVDAKEKG